MKVISRFAPSPTGKVMPDGTIKSSGLHLGGARCALFCWLGSKGNMLLRIEDSNLELYSEETERNMYESLKWLGITTIGEVWRQSERFHIYKEYVDKLIASGDAYKCFCKKEVLDAKKEEQLKDTGKIIYDRTCLANQNQDLPYVVRFKTRDNGSTQWKDLVLNKMRVQNADVGDFVLLRQDGSPTYILANTVDDYLAGVTSVLRGIDGASNCPKQLMLLEALGSHTIEYGHTPFVLGEDKQKLSKSNGAASVLEYRDMGILPEALTNYLLKLGFSYKDKELFTKEEMFELFSPKLVGKAPAVFDMTKLLWFNSQYIKMSTPELLADLLLPFMKTKPQAGQPDLKEVVKTLQKRSSTLVEMAEKAEFYYKAPGKQKFDAEELDVLAATLEAVESVKDNVIKLEDAVTSALLNKKMSIRTHGNVIRRALTGSTVSPGLWEMMCVLGRAETSKRLKEAL